MSVINACLLFVRKSQYLAQCNSDSRISRYAESHAMSKQDAANACDAYFIEIAIISIVLSFFFNVMNASVSAGHSN
jgi:hypothetical protein